jgi:ABC-2 type transport system permease protein
MIVLERAVRDRGRSMMWWSLGISVLIVVTVALFPSFEGDAGFDEAMADLPDSMKAAFGLTDDVSLTSPAGYLQSQLIGTMIPLVLLIYGIGAGARSIGGSEEDGTLELLLSNPVSRRTVGVQRFGAVTVQLVVIGAVCALVTLVSSAPVGALDGVSVRGLLTAVGGTAALALLFAALAFAVGAATGRRAVGLAVGAGAAVAGYLMEALGQSVPVLDDVLVLSPWHWLLDHNMLAEGPSYVAVVLPLVVAVAFAVAGTALFERRDLR